MIKIKQIASLCVFPIDSADIIIRGIKYPRKTSEEFCHSKISLCMTHINCRVDQPGFSVVPGDKVSAPEVSMQDRRSIRFRKIKVQMIHQIFHTLEVRRIKKCRSSSELRCQSAFPIERPPSIMWSFFLFTETYIVVLIISKLPCVEYISRICKMHGCQLMSKGFKEGLGGYSLTPF